MMARIQISNAPSGHIIVSFPYNPILISKIKTIDRRRWHPDQKHWSFSNTDDTLQKILKVFEGEELQIDPALKTTTSKLKDTPSPPVGEKGTVPDLRTEQSGVVELGLSPKLSQDFEDLRRDLVSRK